MFKKVGALGRGGGNCLAQMVVPDGDELGIVSFKMGSIGTQLHLPPRTLRIEWGKIQNWTDPVTILENG